MQVYDVPGWLAKPSSSWLAKLSMWSRNEAHKKVSDQKAIESYGAIGQLHASTCGACAMNQTEPTIASVFNKM